MGHEEEEEAGCDDNTALTAGTSCLCEDNGKQGKITIMGWILFIQCFSKHSKHFKLKQSFIYSTFTLVVLS